MTPRISSVICTRNRGEQILPTIETLLANTHPCFEVLVIDQSTNQKTMAAVESYLDHPKFRYIKSTAKGLSIARNHALAEASGDIIAFTDDDCTVPTDWLEKIDDVFQAKPEVAVLNCQVQPAPKKQEDDFIPCYLMERSRIIRSIWDCFEGIGMGAGMAVRKQVIGDMGGFDTALGVGAAFLAGEDHDIILRALTHDWQAYELAETAVIHYGVRSAAEVKELSRRDWMGLGAAYIKFLKCRRWKTSLVLISWPVLRGLLDPFFSIFRLQRPRGMKRIVHYLQGIKAGWQMPIDCQQILYQPQPKTRSHPDGTSL
jgi:glycosyltransferase involved in cell wall biosynthesis